MKYCKLCALWILAGGIACSGGKKEGEENVEAVLPSEANWVYVHTGLENASQYTITDGLKAGDVVITDGNINLAHDAPVEVLTDSN